MSDEEYKKLIMDLLERAKPDQLMAIYYMIVGYMGNS